MKTKLNLIVLIILLPFIGLAQNTVLQAKNQTNQMKVTNLFEYIEQRKDKIDFFIFEFANPDSLKLIKFSKVLKYIELEKIDIEFVNEGASKKYPKAYILTAKDPIIYNQEQLIKRANEIEKTAKKQGIDLTGIGYSPIILKKEPHTSTSNDISSKNLIRISGVVSDGKETLPYATIGIINKNIGTISNELGAFTLDIPESNKDDELTFSYIGYKTQTFKINEIDHSKELKIILENQTVVLDEVIISAKSTKKIEKIILGQKRSSDQYGFVHGAGVGAEVTKLMELKKNDKILLNSVSIYINNDNGKQFTLLLNVYEQDQITKMPGKQILKKHIIINSTLEQGWLDVDLSDLSMEIDKPFFVAFQWTSPDIESPSIGLKGSNKNTFTRNTSLGAWKSSDEFPWVIKAEGTKIEFEK